MFENRDHEGVEAFDNKFVTITGHTRPLEKANIPVSNSIVEYGDWVDDWLRDAYIAINGHDPVEDDSEIEIEMVGHEFGEDPLTEEDIRDALAYIDPDVEYTTWVNIGFALADFFDDQTASDLFIEWSKKGQKWQNNSPGQAKAIIQNADSDRVDDDPVTIGTVIKFATKKGWEYPYGASESPQSASLKEARDRYFQLVSNCEKQTQVKKAHCAFQVIDHLVDIAYHNEVLWVCEDGVWRDNGKQVLREVALKIMESSYATGVMNELVERFKANNYLNEMSPPEGKLPLKNGLLDLDTRVLRPLEPEDYCKAVIPHKYDPDADCTTFRKFLNDVTESSEDQRLLQEYVGYCLMHWGIPYHKHLFLVGETNTGKSTFSDIVSDFLGEQATRSIPFQNLANQRFHKYRLEGAWANIANDISAELVKNTGVAKAIMSGDSITVERKNKDPYDIRPKAKHIYSANTLPDAENKDAAFFGRIILLTFPHQIAPEDQDKQLREKCRAEMSGILNWALVGYDRLQERGHFDAPGPEAVRTKWHSQGNSIQQFCEDCIAMAPNCKTPKSEVYEAYMGYCEEQGLQLKSQSMLTRRLHDYNLFISDTRLRVGDDVVRAYKGVELDC